MLKNVEDQLIIIINWKEIQKNSELLFWDALYDYFYCIFFLYFALINIEKFLVLKICPNWAAKKIQLKSSLSKDGELARIYVMPWIIPKADNPLGTWLD